MLDAETILSNNMVSCDSGKVIFNRVGCEITVGQIGIADINETINSGAFIPKFHKLVLSKSTCILPPSGIIVLFSNEIFLLPDNVFCFAVPKNALSHQGIHIFNSGIIDPGFIGPISAIACNFSGVDREIKIGDSFLRAAFQKTDDMSIKKLDVTKDEIELKRKEYIDIHLSKFKLSSNFSNLNGIIASQAEDIISEYVVSNKEELDRSFSHFRGEIAENIASFRIQMAELRQDTIEECSKTIESSRKELKSYVRNWIAMVSAGLALIIGVFAFLVSNHEAISSLLSSLHRARIEDSAIAEKNNIATNKKTP